MHTPGAWRLINTNGGWQIARLGRPGYVAVQHTGNPEAETAMHDLYADAVKAASLPVKAAPDLQKSVEALLELHIAHHNHPVHAAARAALRKAKGQGE